MSAPAPGRGMIGGAREKRLSVDKMPMLGKLADDIAGLTLDAFRTRLSSPAQFRRHSMGSDREEIILAGAGSACLPAILNDPEWDCNLAVLLQPDFAFTLVEVTLGADGSDAAYCEQRAFSTIERGLTKCFLDALLLGIARALAPMQASAFAFEKFDTRLDFIKLGARGEDAVTINYVLEALGRSGKLSLVLPQRALNRIAAQLAESPTSPARRPDPQWTRDFEHRVTGAEVPLRAYTEIEGYRLGDVAGFMQGQVLSLPEHAQRSLTLVAEGRPLFTCELGQSEGQYSVRVEGEYDPEAAKTHAASNFGH